MYRLFADLRKFTYTVGIHFTKGLHSVALLQSRSKSRSPKRFATIGLDPRVNAFIGPRDSGGCPDHQRIHDRYTLQGLAFKVGDAVIATPCFDFYTAIAHPRQTRQLETSGSDTMQDI
jgi:hypothetical protein